MAGPPLSPCNRVKFMFGVWPGMKLLTWQVSTPPAATPAQNMFEVTFSPALAWSRPRLLMQVDVSTTVIWACNNMHSTPLRVLSKLRVPLSERVKLSQSLFFPSQWLSSEKLRVDRYLFWTKQWVFTLVSVGGRSLMGRQTGLILGLLKSGTGKFSLISAKSLSNVEAS